MQAERSRRPTGGVVAAVVGLGLFLYFVQRAGVAEIVDGIRRLGWVFVVVVGLGGARFLVRTLAWLRCLDGPHRLRLRDVFQAVIVGDALGNLTPLSIIVGEPAKGIFLRHREPLRRTLPALAVENLFYTLSAILVIAGGLVTVFLIFQTSGQLWLTTSAVVAAMVGLVTGVHWIIWTDRRVASGTLRWLHDRGVVPHLTGPVASRTRRLEDYVHSLYPRRASRLVPLGLLELCFHLLAILEIYLVLSVLSDQPPTMLHAFVFESTNRFISFAFRFVPLRIGVDEAGTGMFADLLAFGTATGVTLAIIRKGRILTWIAIGTACLVRRGLSLQQFLDAPRDDVVVVIMARSPRGGRPPKTRLEPVIPGVADRRRVYEAFLHDTVAGARAVPDASLRIAYTPDGGAEGFDTIDIETAELLGQRGDDLGDRERSVFADLFTSGFTRVVMVGSDLPTLPVAHITAAVEQLDESSVVLGPAEDGGYYLIALSRSKAAPSRVPDVFSGVRWSTPSTLDDTKAAAARAGLAVKLVPPWHDVDDPDGLDRLREELRDPAGRERAPATAKVLDELFDQRES